MNKDVCWHSRCTCSTSKQLPARSPLRAQPEPLPCAGDGGRFSWRGAPQQTCVYRGVYWVVRERKETAVPVAPSFGHTQLNLSQNYSSVLRRTLKACPNTLPSLQMGLGKESRDTVKSESLLENQIHRLGKFSRATPSWPVGKPQGDCQRLQGGQS